MTDPAGLVDAVQRGDGGVDRVALARLLSIVEAGGEAAHAVMAALPVTAADAAWTVGVTGAPGAGKSTLTAALVRHLRLTGARIGVLAIDPSSPFTGGAILGDRVRMHDHTTDPDVFIRSMATRGHQGGLARAVPQAIRVLAAAGHDWIVVETVGVGQIEVEIAGTADTTVVVVNQADRDGVAATVHDLQGMLDLAGERAWRPPVLETVATTDRGVDALVDAIGRHRASEEGSGDLAQRREQRIADEIRALVLDRLIKQADDFCSGTRFATVVRRVADGESDPYTAATLLTEGDDGGEA